jgi:hypothetical protein
MRHFLAIIIVLTLSGQASGFGFNAYRNMPLNDGNLLRSGKYTTLESAAEAASGKTLYVNSNLSVSTNVNLTTIPVRVVEGGGFTNSGTGSISFGSFSAPPSSKVFYGFTSGISGIKRVFAEWWGANPNDDTPELAEIQAAITCAGDRGKWIVRNHIWPYGYKISGGLFVAGDEFSIEYEGGGRNEYTPRIYTSGSNYTMITVTGYGFRQQGVTLWGDGTLTTYGTINGVVLDRSSNGDLETYGNLDAHIEDNGFFYLKDAFSARGRNVNTLKNTFVACKNGYLPTVHTYSGGTLKAQSRGHRINDNRFHSMGNPVYQPESAGGIAWASRSSDDRDSWCIKAPHDDAYFYGNEIRDNFADFSMGFYQGSLIATDFVGNQSLGAGGALVDTQTPSVTMNADLSSVESNAPLPSSRVAYNTFIGRTVGNNESRPDSTKLEEPQVAINADNYANMEIVDNTISRTAKQAIVAKLQYATVDRNKITESNYSKEYHTLSLPAVYLEFTAGNNAVRHNTIRNASASGVATRAYTYGLEILSNSSTDYNSITVVADNVVRPGSAGGTGIKTANCIVGRYDDGYLAVRDRSSTGSSTAGLRVYKQNTDLSEGVYGEIDWLVRNSVAGSEGANIRLRASKMGIMTDMLTLNRDGGATIHACTYSAPFYLGTYALWIEVATGKLRIKSGTPSSDSDGIIVGQQ